MFGPQPGRQYLAESQYLLYDQGMSVYTTEVESRGWVLTRSGIDELVDNSIPFVGTAVGNIPFANISHGRNVEKREEFFAESEKQEEFSAESTGTEYL